MKLKSLTINNFMGYKGEHKINFETENNAKVILFLGENGHGKTTIHHAARWCLYGETRKGQKVISESALFNRPAKLLAQNDLTTSMSVTMEWEDEGHQYQLTRDCNFVTHDDMKVEDFLRIDKENSVPQSSIKHYVQMFFAKEISHFFFFDGEWQREFDQMAENDEEAVYIKTEIEKTLSIPTISNAINWIETKRVEEYKSISSLDKKKEKDDGLKNRLEDLEKQINLESQEIKSLEDENSKDTSRLNVIRELIGNFDSVQSEHDRMVNLRGQIQNNNNRKQQYLMDIKEDLSSNVRWSPIARTLSKKYEEITNALNELNASTNRTNNLKKVIEDLIALRDKKICPVCESVPTKDSEHFTFKIEEAQKELLAIDLNNNSEIQNQFNYIKELGFNQTKISNLRNRIKEFNEASAVSVTLNQELKEIETKLSFSPDLDVKNLMDEANSLSSNIAKRDLHLINHRKNFKTYTNEQATTQSKLSKASDVSPQKRYTFAAFAYLKSLFETSKENYVSEIRKEVEKYASETFTKIISDKKFDGLQINENFGVGLRMKDGSIETLRSTGQGKVSAISLISGLLQTSMKDGFILMDTPFVSLDMGHREQVCKWAAESNMNVSLFLHSGEFVKERDLGMLENKVGRIYRIRKLSDDETSIQVEN
jgi:DNA sulfur modification protein DndD